MPTKEGRVMAVRRVLKGMAAPIFSQGWFCGVLQLQFLFLVRESANDTQFD